ncbi:MAG: GNAT family N-acetyltransferase [Chitinophagaceae bacterium]
MNHFIREIQENDNAAVAAIIRSVLEEHGINKPGTAYYDDSLQYMSGFYCTPRSTYLVGMDGDTIVGGAGVYPTAGLPDGTSELVKMYLLPEARGKGWGKALIGKCIAFAREKGYTSMYLETMPELEAAVQIYQRMGFTLLPHALGRSGHYFCTIHMIKEIG